MGRRRRRRRALKKWQSFTSPHFSLLSASKRWKKRRRIPPSSFPSFGSPSHSHMSAQNGSVYCPPPPLSLFFLPPAKKREIEKGKKAKRGAGGRIERRRRRRRRGSLSLLFRPLPFPPSRGNKVELISQGKKAKVFFWGGRSVGSSSGGGACLGCVLLLLSQTLLGRKGVLPGEGRGEKKKEGR